MLTRSLLAASAVLAVSACMTAPDEPAGLTATQWTLVNVREPASAAARTVPPGQYTLDLQTQNRMAMKLDCNRGNGTWSVMQGAGMAPTIRFSPIATTRAMCPDEGQGSRLAMNLAGEWPYERYDGRLTIRTANGIYTFDSID